MRFADVSHPRELPARCSDDQSHLTECTIVNAALISILISILILLQLGQASPGQKATASRKTNGIGANSGNSWFEQAPY
jgi:hypothetical protein